MSPSGPAIPRLLHQTWKTLEPPAAFDALRQSWLHHNPGWRYLFWDDAALEALVREQYPSLLDTFLGYRDPVCRADAGRYLVLHAFGGVYADLDYECLRPLDGWLDGRQLVLGEEPSSHLALEAPRVRGLQRIACTAFIASTAAHPFWEEVIAQLPSASRHRDVMDATGPFLITRLLDQRRRSDVQVLPAEQLYPVDKFACWDGCISDPAFWDAHTGAAFGVHYWDGSWFQQPSGARARGPTAARLVPGPPVQVGPAAAAPAGAAPVVCLVGHFGSSSGLGAAARGTAAALQAADLPLLLEDLPQPDPVPVAGPGATATAGTQAAATVVHTNPDALRDALAARPQLASTLASSPAIAAWAWESATALPPYWRQLLDRFSEVWVPSELARSAVALEARCPVVVIPHAVPRPPPPALSRADLGIAADEFLYLFVFDGPSNVARKNPFGLVRAFQIAFPEPLPRVRLLLRGRRMPPAAHAELVQQIGGRTDITLETRDLPADALNALLAASDCYVSLHRGEGFGLTMAEAMAHGRPVIATEVPGAAEFLHDSSYLPVRSQLRLLPTANGYYCAGTPWREPDLGHAAACMRWVLEHRAEAAALGARAAAEVERLLSPAAVGRRMRERLARYLPAPACALAAASHVPTVLVLTPAKDAARHLQRYAELLARLDHPRQALSLGILHGDSSDDTAAELERLRPRLERRCAEVHILQHDFGLRLPGPRWLPHLQRQRRAVLARARNRLLSATLRHQAWVLWLDVDLDDYPPDLLARMLASGREVVAPLCIRADGIAYDLNTFVHDPSRGATEDAADLLDGLYQPPRGKGRRYLDEFAEGAPVRVDGVGGAALLVRADLHRDGLIFPAAPYRGYIETEGLAMLAADMGIACWGLPGLRIVHVDERVPARR